MTERRPLALCTSVTVLPSLGGTGPTLTWSMPLARSTPTIRPSATGSSPTSSPENAGSEPARTGCSVCAAHTVSSRSLPPRGAEEQDPGSRCMMTWSAGPSVPGPRTSCGSPTSPSTEPMRASSACAVKDAFSLSHRRLLDAGSDEGLAVAALRNAIGLRAPAGTVVHSDRGSRPSSARGSSCGPFDRTA